MGEQEKRKKEKRETETYVRCGGMRRLSKSESCMELVDMKIVVVSVIAFALFGEERG